MSRRPRWRRSRPARSSRSLRSAALRAIPTTHRSLPRVHGQPGVGRSLRGLQRGPIRAANDQDERSNVLVPSLSYSADREMFARATADCAALSKRSASVPARNRLARSLIAISSRRPNWGPYRSRSLRSRSSPVRSKRASRADRTRSLPSGSTPVRSKRASRTYRMRSLRSRSSRSARNALSTKAYRTRSLRSRSSPLRSKRALRRLTDADLFAREPLRSARNVIRFASGPRRPHRALPRVARDQRFDRSAVRSEGRGLRCESGTVKLRRPQIATVRIRPGRRPEGRSLRVERRSGRGELAGVAREGERGRCRGVVWLVAAAAGVPRRGGGHVVAERPRRVGGPGVPFSRGLNSVPRGA